MTFKKLGFIALLMSTSVISNAMDTQDDYEKWVESILNSNGGNECLEEAPTTNHSSVEDQNEETPAKKQKLEEGLKADPMAIETQQGMKRPRTGNQEEIDGAKKQKSENEDIILSPFETLPNDLFSVIFSDIFHNGTYQDVTNLLCLSNYFTKRITSYPPSFNILHYPKYIKTSYPIEYKPAKNLWNEFQEKIKPLSFYRDDDGINENYLRLKNIIKAIKIRQDNFFLPKILPLMINATYEPSFFPHVYTSKDNYPNRISDLLNTSFLYMNYFSEIELMNINNISIMQALTKLESLSVDEFDLVSHDVDISFFNHLTNLKGIEIITFSVNIGQMAPYDLLTNLTKLTSLKLCDSEGFDFDEKKLEFLSKLPNLTELSLDGAEGLSSLLELETMTQLKSLCICQNDWKFETTESLLPLINLTNLEKLSLKGWYVNQSDYIGVYKGSYEVDHRIFNNLTNLQSLDIENLPLSHFARAEDFPYLTNLKKLELPNPDIIIQTLNMMQNNYLYFEQ